MNYLVEGFYYEGRVIDTRRVDIRSRVPRLGGDGYFSRSYFKMEIFISMIVTYF